MTPKLASAYSGKRLTCATAIFFASLILTVAIVITSAASQQDIKLELATTDEAIKKLDEQLTRVKNRKPQAINTANDLAPLKQHYATLLSGRVQSTAWLSVLTELDEPNVWLTTIDITPGHSARFGGLSIDKTQLSSWLYAAPKHRALSNYSVANTSIRNNESETKEPIKFTLTLSSKGLL